MSSRLKKTLAGAAALVVLGAGGAAIVQASSDGEGSVTGPQADKAKAAALRITNGATANAVERDGENGATWEVEVTKPDGTTVDVRLDERFDLVVVEGDDDGSE
ncbi:MAG: hypothetical protein M3401_15815 [Actinomycetota bacterium]|nr:hypothetical protein [Actinomycetota bacterium]